MDKLHEARIEADGVRSQVFLDGKPLHVQSVTLRLCATELPVLTVSVPLRRVAVDGRVLLNLSVTDEELLADMGWTPPPEEDEPA